MSIWSSPTPGRGFAPTTAVSIENVVNATGPAQTGGMAGSPPKPFLLFGQALSGRPPGEKRG